MADKKPILDPQKKEALLKESLKVMTLAQNVSGDLSAPAPEGWRIIAATSASGASGTDGLYARIYERTGPVPPGEKKYAVAFRGTDKLSDRGDLESDINIAFRKVPDQYWAALDFVEAACKENNINPSEMLYTGHSLGGYLARTVGTTLGARNIWTFNSPGPTGKLRDELGNYIPGLSAPPGDGLVQIRSSYDLVSAWGYKEGITIDVQTQDNHHGLKSLRQAVVNTLEGRAPERKEKKELSLSSIFNRLSRKVAESSLANAVIDRLVDNGPAVRSIAARNKPSIG